MLTMLFPTFIVKTPKIHLLPWRKVTTFSLNRSRFQRWHPLFFIPPLEIVFFFWRLKHYFHIFVCNMVYIWKIKWQEVIQVD